MKWIIFVLLTSFFVILLTVLFSPYNILKSGKQFPTPTKGDYRMKIISSAFEHNTMMPSMYTCDGVNINPPLTFEDIPKEAESLVLLVDDPDAPGGTFHHWSIYNMDPTTTHIEENAKLTSGVEGITSYGTTGYKGPCPPSGTHRYFFKLYALDTKLDLPDKATYNEIQNAMQNHILASSELIGLYSRSK